MDAQNHHTIQEQRDRLAAELMEFGFDQVYVQKAVTITLDKERAAEIVMKLVEEGPDTDLTMYYPIQSYPKVMEEPLVGGQLPVTKPIRAKMLFVVNGSLKMGKGKICAQVGHGVIGGYLQIEETSRFDERSRLRLNSWENSGGAKVVVKAKDLEQMMEIKDKLEKLQNGINIHIVEDMGHTQIPSGSKTVMAIGPAFSNEIDPITEHLKLL